MNELLKIENKVGYATDADNIFRGLSTNDDIVGKIGYWSIVSLSVGGDVLSSKDEIYLENIVNATNACDPHIWPLKLAWFAAGYGHALAGMASTIGSLSHALIGPYAIRRAAIQLDICMKMDTVQLRTFLFKQKESHAIEGAGVVGRAKDERVTAMQNICRDMGYDNTPRMKKLSEIESIISEFNLETNAAGMWACVAQDLGYSAEQAELLITLALSTAIYANAHDAAATQSMLLRNLPNSVVNYAGKPPRLSPKAEPG